MQIIRRECADYGRTVKGILQRSPFSSEVDAAVGAILAAVRQRGDAAVCELARQYDHVELEPSAFRVSAAELAAAAAETPAPVRLAIETAVRQVGEFSRQGLPRKWSFSPRPGVTLGEQYSPLQRVGCYVPGGTAPLISTVVHTATLASVAGVPEIVVTTPPDRQGKVNPALLYACQQAGATEVYRLGGVYGVAALAYGTESVVKVEKIVGPGNAYVTAAKRQVYGQVSLDLVAGPSEIMIIADASARADYIAADMLSQAEHGSGREQAVLLTTSAGLLAEVARELSEQSRRLGRAACVEKVLAEGVFLIEVRDLDEAAEWASFYAPEHLELHTAAPESLAGRITAAGAIFLGPWTPEPAGDFVAGPSHVLPTGGSGRFFNGLTVEMFFRRSSLVQYTRSALASELAHIQSFAACEGLDAHGRSAGIRFES